MNITKEQVWYTVLQDLLRTGADYTYALQGADSAVDAFNKKFNPSKENS